MKQHTPYIIVLALLMGLWACGGKDPDPQAQLPSYLRIPATLTGYVGSGLVTVSGDLSLRAEGPESLNASTKTYSGVLGGVSDDDVTANFTAGQPLPYSQTYSVPKELVANGQLLTLNAINAGTYPMGYQSKPTPTGAQADLILNLAGPQLYAARLGTLTITESTIIKTEGANNLYRIQGTFQVTMSGTGIGTIGTKDYNITGTFDLLLPD